MLTGPARYTDTDGDAALSQGDQLTLGFSVPVTADGASAADFALPVTGDTLGAGAQVFEAKAGNDLRFRSITGSGDVVVTQNANDVEVAFTETHTTLTSNAVAGTITYTNENGDVTVVNLSNLVSE